MSKRLLMLALVVFSLPIHGQPNAKHPEQHKKISDGAVQPSSVTAMNQQVPQTQARRAEDDSQSYFEALIAPNNVPQLLLCITAIGGIAVGICTLIRLDKQNRIALRSTYAASRAAKAALAQANHIVTSERPWILVCCTSMEWIQRDSGDDIYHHFRATIVLKNWGKTPAFIRLSDCGAFLEKSPGSITSPLPQFGESHQIRTAAKTVIAPGEAEASIAVVSDEGLTKSQWFTRINHETEHPLPIVFGVIKYDDSFGNGHETRFATVAGTAGGLFWSALKA